MEYIISMFDVENSDDINVTNELTEVCDRCDFCDFCDCDSSGNW